eukprot:TRINITY_DN15275_c0_g1_i1.p1 TRINITY_DN15275_c0_g1~~TRINITY_DN15275_c0_g1_i1.p1  ORF type:complete len:157 (+),score=35.41 TRINITY_DN15275_c0_g1_i1:29-499(+)
MTLFVLFVFFFFKQKTAYEMLRSLVGSEMCIRDRVQISPVCVGVEMDVVAAVVRNLPFWCMTCSSTPHLSETQGHTNDSTHVCLSLSHKKIQFHFEQFYSCLLYTSDAADEEDSVDLGGRRIIKKKNKKQKKLFICESIVDTKRTEVRVTRREEAD